jgi:hypothetical protein
MCDVDNLFNTDKSENKTDEKFNLLFVTCYKFVSYFKYEAFEFIITISNTKHYRSIRVLGGPIFPCERRTIRETLRNR